MTNGTVFVASPRAIGMMPEASGSSVPACPAFLALKARFTTATAWVEVMPTPLSSTSQPLTSRFFARGARARASGSGARSSVILAVIRVGEIPPYLLALQECVDSRRLVEALVAAEAQLGGEFEVHAVGDLVAQ